MVNVYVFRDDGTTPANWSEIDAGYRERFLLLGGTVLETGGSDTHTHTTSNSWVGGPTVLCCTTAAGSGGPNRTTNNHTHGGSGGNAWCGAANHLPSYKNFRLIYRSTTGWDGRVPSGSILFRADVPAGWTRTCEGESYFIRISSTAGGTGGGASHNHWLSGETQGESALGCGGYNPPDYDISNQWHHHDYGVTSSSDNNDYNYWSCGLIKANADAFIESNTYALFDGDPGNKWESVSADGRFLKISSTNGVITGGAATTLTHNHGGSSSLTTGSTADNYCGNTFSTGGTGRPFCTHAHGLTVAIQSQSVTPSYVRLLLYRSLEYIEYPNTYTTAYDLDLLVKRLAEVSVSSDLLLQARDFSASSDLDILLRKSIEPSWSMSARLIPSGYDLDYDFDVLLKKMGINISTTNDLLLQKRSIQQALTADMLLEKLGLGVTVVIDILIRKTQTKTYAIDHLLRKAFQVSAAVDMQTEIEIAVSYLIDLVAKRVIPRDYAANLLQKKFGIQVSAAFDLLQEKVITRTFDEDLLLKMPGLNISVSQDMILWNQVNKTYSLDQLLKKAWDASIPMDLRARGDIVAIYQMDFSSGRTTKLAYLIEALVFGPDDVVLRMDIVLSSRPTVYRPLRRYPTTSEMPEGQEEVHGEPFDPSYAWRKARTYPELQVDPPTPDVHSENFDYQKKERKNRNIKAAYR